MLHSLHIANVALIDEIDIEFTPGLNILSGETGAGKSVIIGSVSIALGGKLPKDILKDPQKSGFIELGFTLDRMENSFVSLLQEKMIDVPEDGELLISRKITGTKSVCRINGETISASDLRDITDRLLDLHGQHEHQSLLKKAKHLEILDEFGKAQIAGAKQKVSELYREYQKTIHDLAEMDLDDTKRFREMDFCEYELNEIDAAHLIEGEEEDLMTQFKKANSAATLVQGLSEIYDEINASRTSASEAVERSLKVISHLVTLDEGLTPIHDELMDLESLLHDVSLDVNSYLSGISQDEELLSSLQGRLDLIHDMKRKYGNTYEEIMAHRDSCEKRLAFLRDYEERKSTLTAQKQRLENDLTVACDTLTSLRKKYAKSFEKELKESLVGLNFLTVEFEVSFEKAERFSANGNDDVSFLISTNPGSPIRPLEQIASGGELSRIMLAIKSIMARTDDVDTLIFDEIDTGISGRTAQKVAELLGKISKDRQVICISHLPQIVSMADTHFLIEKDTDQSSTHTDIFVLDEEASVKEIARMLGGKEINDLVLENARQMKQMAKTETRA
ncbi:MAG: DNA repair protein RecN [Lachnospiraceae bacterium]|nr:DNA repair protein RecN [Lachnospiraceae bacterium]